MTSPYARAVQLIADLIDELNVIGLGDVLSKGGVGSILLAHRLGHQLVPGDKGPDAKDGSGSLFEYKVSNTNQFNFNFGGASDAQFAREQVDRHFASIAGAYCGLRSGATFVSIAYCPSLPLTKHLKEYFSQSQSKTLVKNFSMEAFSQLPGAQRIL
ncbi:MAG: hypothetical protein NW201_01665 [Gemmatimonadales bacterium]|nr:hypothetical protein [Gemmatimonadales bacterium]